MLRIGVLGAKNGGQRPPTLSPQAGRGARARGARLNSPPTARQHAPMKRHAEIVGAGFAGLTAACALARRGWSVRVHERGERLRTTGAGIYIYENGLRVLEAVGAYQAAIRGAPFAHTREVRDDRNRTISTHQ